MEDQTIQIIAQEIYQKRQEIINLFCKTFILSQEPKSPEELRALFELVELECRIDGLNQTFRIKLKG